MGNNCSACHCFICTARYRPNGELKSMGITPLFTPIKMKRVRIPKQWIENGRQFVKNDPGMQKYLQEQLSKLYPHEDEKILGGLKDED